MSAFIRLFLIILINSHILLYPSNVPEESYRTLKIWNNTKLIGTMKEKIASQKNSFQYEKYIQYLSGEAIQAKFKIAHDFSFFNGEILKTGDEKIFISTENVKITKNGKVRNYKLSPGLLPSSIVHLYIHELLKKGKELPKKIKIFYENTGDIIEVETKILKKDRNIEIKYLFDRINILMIELFFPERDAYFIECGPIYIIDENLENNFIPLIMNEHRRQSNTVTTFENFDGFHKANSIQYKLDFSSISEISIPEDNRQKIIKKDGNNHEKTFLLKISKEDVIYEEHTKKYNDHLLPFDISENIKKLSYKITKGVIEKDKKIQKLIEWIKENISTSKDGPFDPELVIKHRKGDCQGISNLFLAMCSALKIPGKAVVGIIILNNEKGEYFYSFHQWVELREEDHWRPFDPTFGLRGIGLNYIKLLDLENKLDLLKLVNFLKYLRIEIVKEE